MSAHHCSSLSIYVVWTCALTYARASGPQGNACEQVENDRFLSTDHRPTSLCEVIWKTPWHRSTAWWEECRGKSAKALCDCCPPAFTGHCAASVNLHRTFFLFSSVFPTRTAFYLTFLHFILIHIFSVFHTSSAPVCCRHSLPSLCRRMRWRSWQRTWNSVGTKGHAWRFGGPHQCSRVSLLPYNAWRRHTVCPVWENTARPSWRCGMRPIHSLSLSLCLSVGLSETTSAVSWPCLRSSEQLFSCWGSNKPSHCCCLFSWGWKQQDVLKEKQNISQTEVWLVLNEIKYQNLKPVKNLSRFTLQFYCYKNYCHAHFPLKFSLHCYEKKLNCNLCNFVFGIFYLCSFKCKKC